MGWEVGKVCTCAAHIAVILLIVSNLVLLAAEAHDGLHDAPDFLVWAKLLVFLLFTLELGVRLLVRLRRGLRPDKLWFSELLVICVQGVDVIVTRGREAGSEVHATAYFRILQYLRWFRIVRCLRFIPLFANMKAGAFLDLKKLFCVPSVYSCNWQVQMDHINGALWPLLSYLLVLFFSIFIVATMVTAVVGDDCWQQSDLVRSCGEHFVSIWESLYNVFMATFGSLDFDDLVSPLWDVSGFACVILCLYMPLIDVMKTVLWAHLCQKFVETASKDQLEERLEQLWNKILGPCSGSQLVVRKSSYHARVACAC